MGRPHIRTYRGLVAFPRSRPAARDPLISKAAWMDLLAATGFRGAGAVQAADSQLSLDSRARRALRDRPALVGGAGPWGCRR